LLAAEHEPATIRAFVVPDKQERFISFLTKPQTRKKFIKDLNHFRWFDQRFAVPVLWKIDPSLALLEGHLHGIKNIYRLLQSKGAGKTCWVMSENKDLDGGKWIWSGYSKRLLTERWELSCRAFPGNWRYS
jgi:hypothetical protein